ncbi:MAG TPA: VOC family protein [Acidimicrobiia bacterium]|nr:VOC family protein [Acidimicrobiia bacterium]
MTGQPQPTEMRLVITTNDFDRLVGFYRAGLGLVVRESFETHGRGIVLEAGVATLEILDEEHAAHVDAVEVGAPVAGPLRVAFEVADTVTASASAAAAGAMPLAPPALTPWSSINSRMETPDGLQMTLFSNAG